jgi:hypothetical protein
MGYPLPKIVLLHHLLGQAAVTALSKKRDAGMELHSSLKCRRDSQPQTYGLGIKEIWEIQPEKFRSGEITHSMGHLLGQAAVTALSKKRDAGMELHSSLKCLLGLAIPSESHLRRDSQPQTYGLGIKEIWEIQPEKFRSGEITHSCFIFWNSPYGESHGFG